MATKQNISKNKRILITAGPTWIPIDRVRVISNISSGRLGIELSQESQKKGFDTTLLLGPTAQYVQNGKVRIVAFKYFDELRSILKKELRSKKYSAVIHAAAVADYQPTKILKGKISSKNKRLKLILKPTAKIINTIKKISPKTFLVAFKLDLGVTRNTLIKRALEVLNNARADLVIANTFIKKNYLAYIINPEGQILACAQSKSEISQKLLKIIQKQI